MSVISSVIARIGPRSVIESAVLIGAMLIAVGLGARMLRHEDPIGCFEACQIATNVKDGHGFSFHAGDREGFDTHHVYENTAEDALRYFPTAWVDPVYTYPLVAVMSATGRFYKFAAAWLNPLLFVAVIVLTFRLASRIQGVFTGLFSAVLMAWIMTSHRWDWVVQLNNTVLSTVFVLLFAIALHRAVTAPSVKSAAVLGLAAGATILACPVAIGFLPVALLVIVLANWRRWQLAATSVSIALCIAIAVLAPWAVRNYLTFGEFVPVRTGAGTNMFLGIVAPGVTVDPGSLKNAPAPLWHARDAREAVATTLHTEERILLEEFEVEYALMATGGGFGRMNEAQRDKWFQKESIAYVLEHPKLAGKLAIWKLVGFSTIMGPLCLVLLALAMLGGLVAIKRRRLYLLALVMCIIVYAAPYALIVTYFSRYRLPIEPIVVIAAVITIQELGRSFGFGPRVQPSRMQDRLEAVT